MPTNSTQQAISIAGIKDGVVVMKDGSYRLIFQVAATNFALKSEQEQNSIVFQYQSFLNSLHFPIQIVISSRRLDLTPYIAKIEKVGEAQTSELLKIQTADYVDFLKKLIDIANIMKKTFYVVVSYEPVNIQKIGFLGSILGKNKSAFDHLKISDADYKAHTDQLKERATTIASGLGGMGLHCFQLATEDLIELFYLMYNPDESSKERLKDAAMLASPVIMSESEFKGAAKTPLQPAEPENGMIDNTAVVEAQRREETQQKKQEDEKAAEKEVRVKPKSEVPSPESRVASATAQPPAQVVAPTAATAPAVPVRPVQVGGQPAATVVPSPPVPARPATQPATPPVQNPPPTGAPSGPVQPPAPPVST